MSETIGLIRALVVDAQNALSLERSHAERVRIARALARTSAEAAEAFEGPEAAALRETLRTVTAALTWGSMPHSELRAMMGASIVFSESDAPENARILAAASMRRPPPDKRATILIDVVDPLVDVLRAQAPKRRTVFEHVLGVGRAFEGVT